MAICHFTLATSDVDQTRAFFENALGWRALHRPRNIPMHAAWLEIGPGQELHLVEVPEFLVSVYEREYGRHIAISFPRAEFPALKKRVLRHGGDVFDADRPTPFERFFFRDPNGYVFEVLDADRTPE